MRIGVWICVAIAVTGVIVSFYEVIDKETVRPLDRRISLAEERMAGNAMTLVGMRQSRNVPAETLDALTYKTSHASQLLQKAKKEIEALSWWQKLGRDDQSILDAITEAERLNSEVRSELARILDPYNPHLTPDSP